VLWLVVTPLFRTKHSGHHQTRISYEVGQHLQSPRRTESLNVTTQLYAAGVTAPWVVDYYSAGRNLNVSYGSIVVQLDLLVVLLIPPLVLQVIVSLKKVVGAPPYKSVTVSVDGRMHTHNLQIVSDSLYRKTRINRLNTRNGSTIGPSAYRGFSRFAGAPEKGDIRILSIWASSRGQSTGDSGRDFAGGLPTIPCKYHATHIERNAKRDSHTSTLVDTSQSPVRYLGLTPC
jgi:hypothetical protein